MWRKILPLIVVPLILAGVAYFSLQLTEYCWDQVTNCKGIYAEPLPSGGKGEPMAERVVLVVVDGLRVDASLTMSHLNTLRERGIGLVARTGQPSLSLPSWTLISSGASPEISGVTTNWYVGQVRVDSVFEVAQEAGLKTALVGNADWEMLFSPWVDEGEYLPAPAGCDDLDGRGALDERRLNAALDMIKDGPNLILVYLGALDDFGHCFGGKSREYLEYAEQVDGYVGRLLEAIDLDSTAIILVSDHGHLDQGGHGGWEEVVTQVPLVMAGPGILMGKDGEVSQADIAPTIATLLGTAFPAHGQGRPLSEYLDPRGEAREADWKEQQSVFYHQYLLKVSGGAPSGQATGEMAEEAKTARLNGERLERMPIALLVALIPALYLGIYARKSGLLLPSVGATAYFILYNALYFGRGMGWSLSLFNTEEQIKAFLNERLLEAASIAILVSLVIGLLARKKSARDASYLAMNTSVTIMYGLLLQVALFYLLWNVRFEWYLPDLRWGFKYYLDMLQMVGVGLASLLTIPLALGARWVARRVIK